MKKTISVISLGCPRNLVDSEKLIAEFTKKGYRFQERVSHSDIVIVNTCAFIEEAKKESVDSILRVIDSKKEGKVKKIIVAGCLSERYKKELSEELKEIDEFRGVLGLKQSEPDGQKLTPGHYAYIKISEGCANRCAYCVIPYLKGNYKSRAMGPIIKEAEQLIDKGVKEIILIGQDTSLYGMDLYGKKKLGDLLKKLAGISKNTWIRLLYLHPANLDKKVIGAMRDDKNICRYIDLPLEHINDRILNKMRRRITRKQIVSLIECIRKEIPGVAIRTSFIVGFPGETEKEFKELVSFVKEMRFERLGVFKYSREEGTPAYEYKRQVPEKEKEKRFNALMSAQQQVSKVLNRDLVGKLLKVLVEEKGRDYYIARTEYDAPEIDGLVHVTGKNLKIGNFYNIRITDAYEYDLVGDYESGE